MLYAANTITQDIGPVVNFGSKVVSSGCGAYLSGGNLVLRGKGKHSVTADVTVASTAGGTAVLTLYKNGVAIPGAEATRVVGANGTETLTVFGAVDNLCCCENVITAVVTGVAGTITNAGVLEV